MKGWLAALLLLAGCTVGPRFEPPHPETPAFQPSAKDVPSQTFAGEVDPRWWDRFRDAELSSLIARLARQNLDLAAAAERVEQARAQRTIARAQGLPMLNGQATYQRRRVSPNGIASLEVPAPGAPLEFDYYEPQLTASWEVDLFGRVRRAVEAANANTEAAVEARHGAALSAFAELAEDYLELRLSQAQEDVVRRDVAIAERRRSLVRDRFEQGVATTLDVAQADAQALTIAQDLPSFRTRQSSLINAIGLLLAEPPRALAPELSRTPIVPTAPSLTPVGVASQLTRRRPDIREAEARLHAATAQTGVAVANFYPSLNLNGSFGLESLSLSRLFLWDSRQFMVGPTVNLPIFEGGRLRGVLRLRKSEEREAAIQYRQTVLRAFHEVDDALTAFNEAQRAQAAAGGTLAADRRALAAADQRYGEGLTSLLDVIVAQEDALTAEEALAQAAAQVDERLVDLYRALGGGWTEAPEARGS